tara:strand:+ start:6652 stop:7008 length:357 start_codon:yes stop_codon:yes gene_type:complete
MNTISNLMNEYFSPEEKKENMLKFKSNLPVVAKKSSWKTLKSECSRIFVFKSPVIAAKFSFECIKHSLDSDASYITIYSKDKVKIKINAVSGYITEIEKELMEELDYLYRSIKLDNAK